MNIGTFDNKYKEKGGIKTFIEMKNQLCTLKQISDYFGVKKDRVRQWNHEIFNEIYDPRIKRKEQKINLFANFVKKYGLKKAEELYPKINKYYKKEAINKLKL